MLHSHIVRKLALLASSTSVFFWWNLRDPASKQQLNDYSCYGHYTAPISVDSDPTLDTTHSANSSTAMQGLSQSPYAYVRDPAQLLCIPRIALTITRCSTPPSHPMLVLPSSTLIGFVTDSIAQIASLLWSSPHCDRNI